MKTLLTLLLGVIATAAFAQQPRAWVVPPPASKNYSRDTLLNRLIQERRNAISKQEQKEQLLRKLQEGQGNQRAIDNMPNAINITAVPAPVYNGNNGQGFDVYHSQIDNMPVLMPDSANAASLKIKTDPKIQPAISIQPKKIFLTPKN